MTTDINALDTTPPEMVAQKINGTGLHKKILEELSQNPEGVKTSHIIKTKKTRGIVFVIASVKKELGLKTISPAAVLTILPGVQRREMDGKIRFFLDKTTEAALIASNSDCDSQSSASECSNGVDFAEAVTENNAQAAAVECLRCLKKAYPDAFHWPKNRRSFKEFLQQMEGDFFHRSFRAWLNSDHLKGEETGRLISKNRNVACHKLILELNNLKCLDWQSIYYWDLTMVYEILGQYPTDQLAEWYEYHKQQQALEGDTKLEITGLPASPTVQLTDTLDSEILPPRQSSSEIGNSVAVLNPSPMKPDTIQSSAPVAIHSIPPTVAPPDPPATQPDTNGFDSIIEMEEKLVAESQSVVMEDHKPENNNTINAAIECLRCLNATFSTASEWPTRKKDFKKILRKKETASCHPFFTCWLQNKQLHGNFESLTNRRKKYFGKLETGLCMLGCLRKQTGTIYEWNLNKVAEILDQYPTDQLAQVPSSTTQSRTEIRLTPPSTVPAPAPAIPISGTGTTEMSGGFELIDTQDKLERARLAIYREDLGGFVAIDCEGVPDSLHLIQLATPTEVYVFDCVKLPPESVCAVLKGLLLDSSVVKIFHDLHNDAAALGKIGSVGPLKGVLDTQLMMELLTGNIFVGFNDMLRHLEQPLHPLKRGMKTKFRDNGGGALFAQRPLPKDVLEYAVADVKLLIEAKAKFEEVLGSNMEALLLASADRAESAFLSQGARRICFDVANGYALASPELLLAVRPGDMIAPTPLQVSDDTNVLLDLLPSDLVGDLLDDTKHIADINLDKGRRPHAWVQGKRVFLGNENRLVSTDDINAVVDKMGGFGHDNRAGIEQQLHRVSAIRNRNSDIIGLTLRVGRHVSGNATMISDLLFAADEQQTNSILFLGEPGSGKTTIVREVSRLLADRFNVNIVDTSNEIAGDGDVPHPCVGHSRRMMVQSLNQQGDVMIECVQNHTPDVMVIDEIGRSAEVEAARTCKQRGVRLIASAHGDLRKLVKNPKLRGLVGGVETVTLGDAEARKEGIRAGGGLQKLKSQRAGAPVFDTIVELRRGCLHEWSIVLNAGEAVDCILEGAKYKIQKRTRDPNTGAIQIDLNYN